MPELPEVERVRSVVEAAVAGRRLTYVRVIAPDPIVLGRATGIEALAGRRVRAVRRHGKYFWLELDRAPHLFFHLGMSGWLDVEGRARLRLSARAPEADGVWPPRFTKLVLGTRSHELAFSDPRRLGRVWTAARADEPPIADLGPDCLQSPPTAADVAARVGRSRAPIKTLLLDQARFAGVGNWIADEVLHAAGVDPRRPGGSLTAAAHRALADALREVLTTAVTAEAESERYPSGWLFHRRWRATGDDRPPRLARVTLGGRTTVFCPDRQR